MISKVQKSGIIVHIFALAHLVSVYLFRRFEISDEIFLSLLTISMIVIITHRYGFPLEVSAAFAALCCFAGFYLGTVGGKWLNAAEMPFIARFANEITTFCVTEILGWSTILISARRR